MAQPKKKVQTPETPTCWLCVHGKVHSSATSVTEFIDTASVCCKLGLTQDCLKCRQHYIMKNAN